MATAVPPNPQATNGEHAPASANGAQVLVATSEVAGLDGRPAIPPPRPQAQSAVAAKACWQTEAARRFHAQLLEAVDDALVATDVAGTVTYWNPGAEQLFRVQREDAVGRSLDELLSDASTQQREAPVTLADRDHRFSELDIRLPDGSTVPTLVSVSPLLGEGGTHVGTIAVFRSIHELKEAQGQAARRAAQQAAVADLGRWAIAAEDLDTLARTAARTVTEVLGPECWQASVIWYENPNSRTPLAPLGADLGVPIGRLGQLRAWTHAPVAVRPEDGEFLRGVASILEVAHQREEVRADLHRLATQDALTGLPNRTLLFDRFERAAAAAQRAGESFALLFLDLDGFKLVNDALGHHQADQLLMAVADRLRDVLRASDTVARFGGDEFVILLPDATEPQQALDTAERIQQALASPFRLGGAEIVLNASIGVAMGTGRADAGTLLRQADAAMYRAKSASGSRVELYVDAVPDRARRRLDLASGLRKALRTDAIETRYQPLIDLRTNTIRGVEALARWWRADGTAVPPDEFVSVAEETGMIGELGAHVLELACRDARSWQHQSPEGFFVAVNTAPSQLASPDFGDAVTSILTSSGLPASALLLEVTEDALTDTPMAHSTMQDLRSAGVRFAMDDFGTGHSSLSRLRRMPVDYLKIDQSFVSGLAEDLQDHALVSAAIELARAFGLTTIAEGVETEQQRRTLVDLGCDVAQGHLWSEPVDREAITTHLTEQQRFQTGGDGPGERGLTVSAPRRPGRA